MDARSPSRRELDGGYRVRVSKVMDPRSVSHRSWGLWLRPTWQPTTLALGTDPSVPCPSPLVLPWEGRRRRTPVGRTVGPVRPPRRNGSLGVSTPHSLSLGAADDLRGCPEGPRRDTRTQGNGLTTSSPVVSRPRTSRPRPSRWRRVRRPLLQSEGAPPKVCPRRKQLPCLTEVFQPSNSAQWSLSPCLSPCGVGGQGEVETRVLVTDPLPPSVRGALPSSPPTWQGQDGDGDGTGRDSGTGEEQDGA